MNITEAMRARHSVRQYQDSAWRKRMRTPAGRDRCRQPGKRAAHQLIVDEPKAFDGFMAHYGKFSGVRNYIAMIGKKGADLDELRLLWRTARAARAAAWPEYMLGWAMTYRKIKTAFTIDRGEKLCVVIALGYGENAGASHPVKVFHEVAQADGEIPKWYRDGVEAALLAPTAMNQQKFFFSLKGNQVSVKAGMGFYTKVDLGIVKYHFEQGAGKCGWRWAERS